MDVNSKDTVDGRNLALADMVKIPLLTEFLYIPGGAGFIPSTVLMYRHGGYVKIVVPPPKKKKKTLGVILQVCTLSYFLRYPTYRHFVGKPLCIKN